MTTEQVKKITDKLRDLIAITDCDKFDLSNGCTTGYTDIRKIDAWRAEFKKTGCLPKEIFLLLNEHYKQRVKEKNG